MGSQSTSLLAATGRSGRLASCVAAAVVGLVSVAVCPVLMSHDLSGWGVGLFVSGALVLVVSVVYGLKRIACPQCKMPWLQYALSEKGVGEWLSWLTTFTECPQCRYSVEDAANSSQGHS